MKRLIIFLIRLHLGLKKNEHFQFKNQKSKVNYYYFIDTCVMKADVEAGQLRKSHVSLNWLLNNNCKIIKLKEVNNEDIEIHSGRSDS